MKTLVFDELLTLAMEAREKYSDSIYGNSDKKLQQRANKFLNDNPDITQENVYELFHGIQTLYEEASKKKHKEFITLFNSLSGMLTRAYKKNVWHDKP